MNVLDLSRIRSWCGEHEVALAEDEPADDPALGQWARRSDAEGDRSGREATVAAETVRVLGEWEECLVWVTGWGAWPTEEDWPRFFRWREAHGERRSLEAAPGHWFLAGEERDLEELLTLGMENGWAATVLPARNGIATDRRALLSQDDRIEIRSRQPLERSEGAGTRWQAIRSVATPPVTETRKTEPEPEPEPATDRALLEQIRSQLEDQQADVKTIRWRTGCLFAWLLGTLIFGAILFLLRMG